MATKLESLVITMQRCILCVKLLIRFLFSIKRVNFIREWWDLRFNVDIERQIFEKFFHGRFISSQIFCQKSAEM